MAASLLALLVFTTVASARTQAALVEEVQPTLVQIIQTSAYSPGSPDPAGIVYIAETDRFIISDSEVNEMAQYQGRNLFSATRTGAGTGIGTTLVHKIKEPTGLGYNPADRTLYVTDDDADRISAIRPGADGAYGTADDAVSHFSTAAFSTDAEGVEFDPATGDIFICDGVGTEIYRVDPIDGVFGNGNDVVTNFDLAQHGARDCDGLGLDHVRGTLLAVDPSRKKLYELTKAGVLVRTINLAGIPTTNKSFSAVTLAPSSDPNDHPARMTYWVTDRQVDNGADPNENDGLLYELSLPGDEPPGDGPPTVVVTAPAAGASVGGTVEVRAGASDDGGVSQVEFFADGASIGVDTNGSDGWSASWNTTTVPEGSHSLTATARDQGGQQASHSIAVSVDNTPPSVSVVSPAASATVSGSVTVAADASDNDAVASVQVRVDGVAIGSDTNGADGWSIVWQTAAVANGAHALSTVAHDRAGNATTSAAIQVTVDNPSTIALAVPVPTGSDDADQELESGIVRRTRADLELGTDGVPTVVGTRFPSLSIPQGATIVSAYVQFTTDEHGKNASSLTVSAEQSENSPVLTTTAFDLSSRARTSASVTWTPPQWLSVGEAGPGQRTPDLSAVVQEVINRPGWTAGNALTILVTGSGRRTAFSFEGGRPPVLHVEYTTGGGNEPPEGEEHPPPDAPPLVAVTSPSAGSTVSGTVPITADASDDGAVTSVQFLVDGVGIATDTDGSDGWTTSWNSIGVANGPRTLTAVARDVLGQETTSDPVAVLVDNDTAAPQSTISCNGGACSTAWYAAPVSVSLAATDAGGSGVASIRYTLDGSEPGASSALYAEPFTLSATTVVRYRSFDNAGNTEATKSQTVRIDTAAPSVAVTEPAQNATVTGVVRVSATASDTDSGVAGVAFYANGVLVATSTISPYRVNWNTKKVANGAYSLWAVATDVAGRSSTSASITVTVK